MLALLKKWACNSSKSKSLPSLVGFFPEENTGLNEKACRLLRHL